VEIRFKDGRPQRVTMTQTPAVFPSIKINKKELAAALGVSVSDFHSELQPQYVSTGVSNLMVPFRNRTALGRINMNVHDLRRFEGKNGIMAYCFALNGANKVFTRGMLPWEIYEDPATGSAAGSLAAYLVQNGKLVPALTLYIQQGAEMGRPSQIEVQVSQTGKKLVPRCSGAAVRVFEGTIRI
jgi:PhzF family phenazine biosynthesis protein